MTIILNPLYDSNWNTEGGGHYFAAIFLIWDQYSPGYYMTLCWICWHLFQRKNLLKIISVHPWIHHFFININWSQHLKKSWVNAQPSQIGSASKSHVTPSRWWPWKYSDSRVTVVRGEPPVPLNNLNMWKPQQKTTGLPNSGGCCIANKPGSVKPLCMPAGTKRLL